MKNIKNLLSILFVVVVAGACSKWTQDPMEGQPWSNKSGKPNAGGEKPKPGLSSDNIRIDTEPSYKFQEELEASYKIEARVLLSGYSKPVISIDNLTEFQNGTFDPATGMFTWTPPFGIVEGFDSIDKNLVIKVVAKKTGEFDEVRYESIPVVIKKHNKEPTILSVSQLRPIREGETQKFKVVVRDLNSGKDFETWPRLSVHAARGYSNLAAFISVSSPYRLSNGDFDFNITVNLSGQEVTDSSETFGAQLVAYSAAGVRSVEHDVQMTILTSFSDLTSTWWDEVPVIAEQQTAYSFVIFDPKNEIYLESPTFTDLPFGAIVQCEKRSSSDSRQYCKLEWTPMAGIPEGFFSIHADVVVRNANTTNDTLTQVKKLAFPLRVLPASSPSKALLKEF